MTAARAQQHRLADLLLDMEREMRRIGLWEETPPAPEALASTLPFCYGTLRFTQWLQWVFLARLRQLIAQDAPLPGNSDIHPLAEHSFAELAQDTARLLALIAAVDKALNGH